MTSTILNGDLRWEYYPSDGESLSLGLFAKHFEDPIETIVVVAAQHSVSYDNARGATNLGLELEARKRLGLVAGWLRDVSIAGNATLVRSRVELDASSGIQTSTTRPLQGQAPWVLNGELGYDNPDLGTSLAAFYHITGPRIGEVGALGAPDVIIQPVPTLDLVYRQNLGEGWSASARAKNLLDPVVARRQGGRLTERWRRGRSFGVGLGYQF